jgi:DNA-binding FadR family transcriptional regulator
MSTTNSGQYTTEQEQQRQAAEREARRLVDELEGGDSDAVRQQAQQLAHVLNEFFYVADGGDRDK